MKGQKNKHNACFCSTMKKFATLAICLVILFAVAIIVCCTVYNIKIGPVSKDNTIKEIIVEEGETYYTLASTLEENKLIKSSTFFKLYIKLMKPKELVAGKYSLSEDMGVKKIVKELEKGSNYNPDTITITIPEGYHMTEVAELIAEKTNHTKKELLEVWDSKDFISKTIENYWFVTDEVRNSQIRYSLEGYFFPSTYELSNKDVTAEEIANKMLEEMGTILDKYKDTIKNSNYTVHEILTMASIVEHEAILDEDRAEIAGVFYNRLEIDMPLQSCATLGYAIDEWKLTYTSKDMGVDSPYNTYYYKGLPIGPGDMPGEKSIIAAISPNKNNYYYFMANVCDKTNPKTYFSETLSQHNAYVDKYLTCF